ncbi:MAG: sulfite reductase subunit alpha [Roseibacillus sp.]|nr:sulfite reductase subunit alpha [Roseibacillus sp.]|tara:strand:+ start:4263 stop:5996 length:1734 start_codon:yes stop_codon:yes gene_type:complete
MSHRILIPEDAPFTSEQREWLSGFLSKTFGTALDDAAEQDGPVIPVTILVGSQTGNAESCAKKMAKDLNGGRFETEVVDMGQYDPGRLAEEKNLLIITSTYGDGEPPDNAADLYEFILGDEAPTMKGVQFSVLALGDTEYPDFCKCGIDFDNRLESLGAQRFYQRVDCDVDYDEAFASWRKGVVESLGGAASIDTVDSAESESIPFGKKNPFHSPILRNDNLNGPDAEKETHHVELSLEGAGMDYVVGDALGVFPVNQEDQVDEILDSLPFNTNEQVPIPGGGEGSLRDALMTSYDIRALTPKLLQAWQKRSGSPYLRSVVESGDRKVMNEFCWGRELIDLVTEYPADFSDGEEFVTVLKKLQPRLYSIASSPNAHPGEVHLTIAIVRYHSHGRERGGVCSTFFADRAEGLQPGVFVHHNKAFRLVDDDDAPVIMVGPGTGVAPFRAFLEERRVRGAAGKNWLFFGNPHRETDFLYEEEFVSMQKDGILTHLDLAFSRDQEEKIYVQHQMEERGADLWKWLEAGASFYVCGDASRMAKDVDACLHRIVEKHGGKSEDEAKNYIKGLKREKRYQRDVY